MNFVTYAILVVLGIINFLSLAVIHKKLDEVSTLLRKRDS